VKKRFRMESVYCTCTVDINGLEPVLQLTEFLRSYVVEEPRIPSTENVSCFVTDSRYISVVEFLPVDLIRCVDE